ncbi:MAG: DNA polymerase III subunit alpha [Pseudomonadota bacterium]
MSHAPFVHLRVRSAYSLSEGAIKVKDLIKACQAESMPAVAVTDSGNLFGALEFALAARDAGVQPIIGCLMAISRLGKDPLNGALPPPDPIVLLVQNEQGYQNLMALVSKAFLETEAGEPPQISLSDLSASADGLLALTGGMGGQLGRLLLSGQIKEAKEALAALKDIFPGRLYVELQRHGLANEKIIESQLLDLAYDLEVPLVATNDCYFPRVEDFEAHDALLCIAGGTYVTSEDRRRLSPEHRLKSAREMCDLFQDLPEAVANTIVIAQRCAYFPDRVAPILPAFPTHDGLDEAGELARASKTGLQSRLEAHVFAEDMEEGAREAAAGPYRERLDYELGVIEQMGFPGYFLIVADFIQWAKHQGIPVGPGRGSGAGSVVAWALTITDLDPLRWGLLFERFLNPERISMPDFDIDFCQDRRDEVIRYVQEKYGRDHVAQIITFGKLQARAALRDVGRVLEMPYPQVDRICKLVPNNPANPVSLSQAIAGEPQLQEMRDNDPAVARLLSTALGIEGLYRHASTHAAGVVIGDRRLDALVPLYRDPRSDMPVTQFNMKYVEQAGLVKFDFLGLKTLTVLARACELIAERGESIDLSTIPLDDAKTFDMLGRAETVAVFQLESSGMRDVLRRLKPDRFEDIIAVVALYRPGPMDNIPSYIKRKHGEETPDYLHDSIADILKETYGIMIYQEQVLQIAQKLAGYTLGAADILRRAMGKKIQAEMDAQRQTFIEGAVALKVAKTKASEVFDQVNKFAGYGFNKAHAAAYALVAYQTAYLKANYPVELMAATMTYDLGNTDKLNVFRQELQRLGIPLLPPDVNHSLPDFGVETLADGRLAIRYALAAVKNVGAAAMGELVRERKANGAFAGLADFVGRLDSRAVNKRQIENLACAGAFETFVANRRQVYAAAETIVRHATVAASERESDQVSLFGDSGGAPPVELSLPKIEDWPGMERLRHEFDAVGFYLSAHPLDAYGKSLEKLGVVTYQELLTAANLGRHRLAGIVIGKRELTSRKGNRMAFVQCSDTSGVFEVTLFSEALASFRELLEAAQPLHFIVTADRRSEEEDPRLTVQMIEPLDQLAAKSSAGLKVYLDRLEHLSGLQMLLEREGPGRGQVALVLDLADGQEVELELAQKYKLSAALRQAIKAMPGVGMQDT